MIAKKWEVVTVPSNNVFDNYYECSFKVRFAVRVGVNFISQLGHQL